MWKQVSSQGIYPWGNDCSEEALKSPRKTGPWAGNTPDTDFSGDSSDSEKSYNQCGEGRLRESMMSLKSMYLTS